MNAYEKNQKKLARQKVALDKKVATVLESLADEDVLSAFLEKMGGIKGLETLKTCHKELDNTDDDEIAKYLTRTIGLNEMTNSLINKMGDDKGGYILAWLEDIGLDEWDSLNNRATIAQLVGLKEWATVPEIIVAVKSHIS